MKLCRQCSAELPDEAVELFIKGTDGYWGVQTHSLSVAEALYAWMIMPDVYKSYPFTDKVTSNAYGSLMEIDHLQGDKKLLESEPYEQYGNK